MDVKLKSDIERIQGELRQFLVDTLKAEHFDVIVPVARKGLFLLKTAELQSIQDYKICLYPLEGNVNLKGKKILILDNSATSGDTILSVIQDLKNHHANDNDIATAVFIIHPKTRAPIRYKKYVEQGSKAEEIRNLLKAYFSSLCFQLDDDHLVLNCQVRTSREVPNVSEICSNVKIILQRYGNFCPLKTTATLWGREKFEVNDLKAEDYGLSAFSTFWQEEGVFKVRFCLESDFVLNMVLIFCPEIIPDRSGCRQLLRARFCELSEECVSDTICRDCVNFNLLATFSASFSSMFRQDLKMHKYSLDVVGISWPELELRHEGFAGKVLKELLDSVRM